MVNSHQKCPIAAVCHDFLRSYNPLTQLNTFYRANANNEGAQLRVKWGNKTVTAVVQKYSRTDKITSLKLSVLSEIDKGDLKEFAKSLDERGIPVSELEFIDTWGTKNRTQYLSQNILRANYPNCNF